MCNLVHKFMKKGDLTLNEMLYLIAVFINNLGNGMYTIAISKIVYDQTGSAMVFGIIILIENIISFFIQLISGAISDRSNPKVMTTMGDYIRGFLFIISAIIYIYTENITVLIVAISIVTIITSIYKCSNFKLLSSVVSNSSKYLRINSLYSILIQIGQIIGVLLVTPIIFVFNTQSLLIFNGLTFCIAAFINSNLKLENKNIVNNISNKDIKFNNILSDWKLTFIKLYRNINLTLIIVFSIIDTLAVSFVNIMLVPFVSVYYPNKQYMLSLLDGSFALGAIISVVLISKTFKLVGEKKSRYIWIIIQGITFIILSFYKNGILILISIFIIGMTNTFSVVGYQTLLQKNVEDDFKGKMLSIKLFVYSIVSLIIIPFVTKFYDKTISYGIFMSGVVLLGIGIIIKIFLRIYKVK